MRSSQHGTANRIVRAVLWGWSGAAALLVACDAAEPPIARHPLPVLERPVTQLQHRAERPRDIEQPNILIPARALVERGGFPGVFVLSPAREARFRMVRVGRVDGGRAEILSGLHGDETLVLGDLSAVHDGSPIRVQ